MARLPLLRPINFCVDAWSSANSRQHPLGGVDILWAWARSFADKVVDERLRFPANFSKVHRCSSTGQEKEPVKPLKQRCRRLVNCAKDSLAVIDKLPQEIAD